MRLKHVGANPLKLASPSATALLALPAERTISRAKKSAGVDPAASTAEGNSMTDSGGSSSSRSATPANARAARRTFTTALPQASVKRRRQHNHLAGAPDAMDTSLREEFRGALRTSLATTVAPVDETRFASLEMRLHAMESTTVPVSDELRATVESLKARLIELEGKLPELEGKLQETPDLEAELDSSLKELAARIDSVAESFAAVGAIESSEQVQLRQLEERMAELAELRTRVSDLEDLPVRLHHLEQSTTELVRVDSVAAVWERLQSVELQRKELVRHDDLGEFFSRVEELGQRAASMESLMAVEGRLAACESREEQLVRRDELKSLLADVQELVELRARVARLEHGRRDMVRPEAISTLEARLREVQVAVESRIECLEVSERELARQSTVTGLSARQETAEARLARAEEGQRSLEQEQRCLADKSSVAELEARLEIVEADDRVAATAGSLAETCQRLELLERDFDSDRRTLQEKVEELAGEQSALAKEHTALSEEHEKVHMLSEELKLQGAEIEDSRRFMTATQSKLALLAREIAEAREGADELQAVSERNQLLTSEVGRLRTELSRRDTALAFLWCVSIAAIALSGFQLLVS